MTSRGYNICWTSGQLLPGQRPTSASSRRAQRAQSFPELRLVASGALAGVVGIAEGLKVDGTRMRANLDATHGLVMTEALSFALAAKIRKHSAHQLLEEASRKAIAEKCHLRDVLGADPRITAHLSVRKIEQLFDPLSHLGALQTFIDRMLAHAKTH